MGDNAATVAPILSKLLTGVVQDTMDRVEPGLDSENDTPFERTLCAAWDVCTVKDYASAITMTSSFHRLLLKIITQTKRPRTRELAMGTLASLAQHWEAGIGPMLLDDIDVLRLCRSILWHENDARVLLETTRLLNVFLSHAIDAHHGTTVIAHDNLTEILFPSDLSLPAPSLFHQYTFIVCNTLHPHLLLISLELMARFVVYAKAVKPEATADVHADTMLAARPFIEKQDCLQLVQWGAERLEEEGRGVGIGMSINRGVAKQVLHLMWTLFAYKLVVSEDCEPNTIRNLDQSMNRLVDHIQKEKYTPDRSDDDDIQRLADALGANLNLDT